MFKLRCKSILALLLSLLLPSVAVAQTHFYAVNVGKGDALLIQGADYTLLIDTGKKSAWEQLEAALEELQIEHLDALFITHTDNDHVGGLTKLRKSGIEIDAIYTSAYCCRYKESKNPVAKTAKKLDLETNYLGAGTEVSIGRDTVLRVLAPLNKSEEEENDNSLVMMLECPDARILLCGDMEDPEEQELLQSGAELKCDVLKVPHHGGANSCSDALIEACAPAYAVISTDSSQKPGTPDERILESLDDANCTCLVTQDYDLWIHLVLNQGQITDLSK